jgi:hypothetical protein
MIGKMAKLAAAVRARSLNDSGCGLKHLLEKGQIDEQGLEDEDKANAPKDRKVAEPADFDRWSLRDRQWIM